MKILTAIIISLLFALSFFLGSFSIETSIVGLISGLFFILAIYLFRNSKPILNQTSVNVERLFSSEKIESSVFANLIIRPADFNLKNFSFDVFFKYLGMKNQEALGGRLHLTNYRLIFKTHRYNRIIGEFSVFLPEIKDIIITGPIFSKKLALITNGSKINYIVNNPLKIKEEILRLKSLLSTADTEKLVISVRENPEKCIDSTEAWQLANKINELLLLKNKVENVAAVFQSPINAIASFYYNEFSDKVFMSEEKEKN